MITHSLVDLPRWGLATADDHSDIFLLHCARSCDISFIWMYSQPVHSSMSCIHCLLGLPWCRSPSMIPSRTVSAFEIRDTVSRTNFMIAFKTRDTVSRTKMWGMHPSLPHIAVVAKSSSYTLFLTSLVALNSLIWADVPLRNFALSHSLATSDNDAYGTAR